jgi:hypothetical protein
MMLGKAFQAIGDALTQALVSGDFALYQSLISLPLKVTSRDAATYTIKTQDGLRADFDLYHRAILIQGVTDIFRDFQEVILVGPGLVAVKFTTHILQRANRVVDPFSSAFHLERQGKIWRITAIESAEAHISWTLGQASVTPAGQFETRDDTNAKT